MEAYSGVFNGTQLKFHAIFFFFFFLKFDRPILDFLQIKFYIETRFLENQVSEQGHFVGTFGRKGYFAIFAL